MYGVKPLEIVLSKADGNVMFLLYPINVVPMGPTTATCTSCAPTASTRSGDMSCLRDT